MKSVSEQIFQFVISLVTKGLSMISLFALVGAAIAFLNLAPARASTTPAGNQGVLNIGDLEVQGEVRKPLLDYIDSEQLIQKQVADTSKSQLQAFEKKILTFRPSAQAQVQKRASDAK